MTHLDRWTAAGLLAISAASLAYELALTRLLSLQQFHHFAFLVVSLPVLASAAGGLLCAPLPLCWSSQPLALGPSIARLGTFAIRSWCGSSPPPAWLAGRFVRSLWAYQQALSMHLRGFSEDLVPSFAVPLGSGSGSQRS